MCNFILSILMMCVLVAPLHAENARTKKRMFWLSVAALGAASVLDVHSSYGKAEGNPLAQSGNGRLGMRGVGIKLGTLGAVVGLESFMQSRHPEFGNKAAVGNFALAGAWTFLAVRNYGIARPPASWNPAAVPAYLK